MPCAFPAWNRTLRSGRSGGRALLRLSRCPQPLHLESGTNAVKLFAQKDFTVPRAADIGLALGQGCGLPRTGRYGIALNSGAEISLRRARSRPAPQSYTTPGSVTPVRSGKFVEQVRCRAAANPSNNVSAPPRCKI